MIQDIAPRALKIGYEHRRDPKPDDYVLFLKAERALVDADGRLPTFCALGYAEGFGRYLFLIDEAGFYLADGALEEAPPGFRYEDPGAFRRTQPQWAAFAGITAVQTAHFYERNRYCPTCAAQLVDRPDERALVCPGCGNVVYPKISPAVIVGVIDGENLLMTKYSGRAFKRYALIAGFCEIGEAPEDAVRREVAEEVGLRVRDIRYYKSQPWGFSESMLLGFFARLDGAPAITLDEHELASAEWIARENIPDDMGERSLTREMILAFKAEEVR